MNADLDHFGTEGSRKDVAFKLAVMFYIVTVFPAAQADIILSPAVTVDVRPKGGNLYVHNQAYLSCLRRGLVNQPDVAYWEKDGVVLITDDRIHFLSSYSKSVVVIETVRKDDMGKYRCVTAALDNGTQLLSYDRVLQVKDMPSVVWQAGNATATIEHENITIRCDTFSTTTRAVFMNRYRIRGKSGRRRLIQHAAGLDLIILNVRPSDAGQYTCWGSDGVENSSSSTWLAVNRPPRITNITLYHTSAGLELVCQAEGNPKPMVKWTSQKTSSLQYKNPLILNIVPDHDIYTCIAENAAGVDSRNVPLPDRLLKGRNATTTEATRMSSTPYNESTTIIAVIAKPHSDMKTIIISVVVVGILTLAVLLLCCCVCRFGIPCKKSRESPTGGEIDGCPTDEELDRVHRRIAFVWEQCARVLGPQPLQHHDIEIIQRNYPRDVAKQAKRMLHQWRSENRDNATVRLLCKAMVEVERRSDAEDVFGEYAVILSITESSV